MNIFCFKYFSDFCFCKMAKDGKKRRRSPSSSSSSGSSSSDDSKSGNDRAISGQKSDGSESEEDIKDQFLLPIFKPKPVKVEVSDWAKSRLRSAFLGTPISKDERVQLTDDYRCSQADHKLFSAPKVAGKIIVTLFCLTQFYLFCFRFTAVVDCVQQLVGNQGHNEDSPISPIRN